jgi:hypothetical protein
MYTGTVWGLTLIILGFMLCLGALQLMAAAVFPGAVAKTANNLERSKVWGLLHFLIGAVPVLLLVAAIAGFGGAGAPGKVLLVLPLGVLTVLAAVGLASVSLAVGRRMPSPVDADRPWRGLMRGAITSQLAYLAPLVGWFFVFPVALVMGSGAALWSAFQFSGRRSAAADLVPFLAAEESLELEATA